MSDTMHTNIDFINTPVVDVVNRILYESAKAGASDIHFDHSESVLKVRIRIDGLLNDFADIPNEVKNNVITRIKILSGMNITETRLPQDGAIKTNLYGLDLDMRVSVLPTKKGEKVVIRILDYTRSLKGIEYLFFSEDNYKKILQMIGEPNGIILVTGATGSGKSTTVYSFLQKLNVKGCNLITVEDPVEMEIEGINQVQVNSEIGLDFAAVLRSILRQDPNVIMVGEIRDSETAQIAVRASITGHLVLSTLHTNNSLTTIERLLDMDVERYLLASALSGIVSQKLARQLCDKCKKKRPATPLEIEMYKNFLNMDVTEVYDAVGCPNCSGGYKGRVALHEVLLINPEIRDAVSAKMPKAELRNLVYKSDVITLLQDGLYKALAGFTTTEEIIKLTEADDELNAETKVKAMIEREKINPNNPNRQNTLEYVNNYVTSKSRSQPQSSNGMTDIQPTNANVNIPQQAVMQGQMMPNAQMRVQQMPQPMQQSMMQPVMQQMPQPQIAKQPVQSVMQGQMMPPQNIQQ